MQREGGKETFLKGIVCYFSSNNVSWPRLVFRNTHHDFGIEVGVSGVL